MKPRILILGRTGQLGRALANQLGPEALTASMQEVNFASPDFIKQLETFLHGKAVRAVINAAAYTQVDKAETEADLAFRVNAEAVDVLAKWCKKQRVPLIHISTDYVFDGSGTSPRLEKSPAHPLNVYGKSKLEGERGIERSGADYLIFRTSWVYDAEGQNFYNTMRRLFKEREVLSVVSDQTGAPTYAPHLAAAITKALEIATHQPSFPAGTYHLCGSGETNWHEFATNILSGIQPYETTLACKNITPITTDEYPTAAKRPLNSRLDCSNAKKVFQIVLPDWHDGLAQCISETYGNRRLQNTRP